MTAIRINPETLEQDGTVALPGMNLQIWEDAYSLLFTCYVLSGKQKRNWDRFWDHEETAFVNDFGLLHYTSCSISFRGLASYSNDWNNIATF